MGTRLVLLLLLCSGCLTTFADLRAQSPDRAADVRGEHQALAGCVKEELFDATTIWLPVNYHLKSEGPESRILGVAAGAIPGPVIDIHFRQADTMVHVETRREHPPIDPSGGPSARLERNVWLALARCMGAPVAVTPPLD